MDLHSADVFVYTYGTNAVSDERLKVAERSVFDLTPRGIIESLNYVGLFIDRPLVSLLGIKPM